jgi:hypothetical protein
MGQMTNTLTIYELANDIADLDVRRQIQSAAKKQVANLAQSAMK